MRAVVRDPHAVRFLCKLKRRYRKELVEFIMTNEKRMTKGYVRFDDNSFVSFPGKRIGSVRKIHVTSGEQIMEVTQRGTRIVS